MVVEIFEVVVGRFRSFLLLVLTTQSLLLLYKRSWMLVCSPHGVLYSLWNTWWILLVTMIYWKKVVNMTNVHEHNDFTVSIKVQQFRSRCAKSVYYNRTRVVWECHVYKRDREPSGVPVMMWKRLSQKIRKLQSYVRSRLSKKVSKSKRVHDLIKNNAAWKKSTYKTRIRYVQKMRRKPVFRTRNVISSMRYVYNSSRDKHGKKYLKYLRFSLCNFPYSEYKGVIHRGNCTKNKPYNDIEKTLFLACTLWIPGKQ